MARTWILIVIVNALLVAGLLLLVEGFSSVALGVYDGVQGLGPQEANVHTDYDPELGWINAAGVSLPDMYGPGIGLSTNSQRFRGSAEYSAFVPDGMVRLICSGDSFTFGHGVDDSETWCNLLSQFDRRFETVNMGKDGYGFDQAYLWYRRDAGEMDHDLHLFAFITSDLERMMNRTFLGYPKPLLRIREGELVTTNVPVPTGALSDLTRVTSQILSQLRMRQFLTRARRRMGWIPDLEPADDREMAQQIVASILDDLQRLNRERGSSLVLVHLPNESDYTGTSETERWQSIVRAAASDRRIPYISMIEALRDVPREELSDLFIQPGSFDPWAAGHYTARGNEFIARGLISRLVGLGLLSCQASTYTCGSELAAPSQLTRDSIEATFSR